MSRRGKQHLAEVGCLCEMTGFVFVAEKYSACPSKLATGCVFSKDPTSWERNFHSPLPPPVPPTPGVPSSHFCKPQGDRSSGILRRGSFPTFQILEMWGFLSLFFKSQTHFPSLQVLCTLNKYLIWGYFDLFLRYQKLSQVAQKAWVLFPSFSRPTQACVRILPLRPRFSTQQTRPEQTNKQTWN